MKFIIIGVWLLCIVATIRIFKHYDVELDFANYILSIVLGFLIGVIVNFILVISITSVVNHYASKKEVVDSTINIKAIDNKQSTNGTFFLGSGSINGRMYYYYMTSEKDGSTQIKKLENNDNVYIIETNSQKPKIIFYKKEFVNPHFKDIMPIYEEKIKIYIPKESLKTNYNIDLEQ
ncbi:hypothetical protein [Clostridium botulinum]|uniref:hypothetical protein n=1 Tax=Clostridium botulinum TaxID=1491 RepID=UPI00174CF627|nr:hypothetical protein [Clostridium botulinum]MBD5589288.1 hypothetical protein [Clostridium botulinum]